MLTNYYFLICSEHFVYFAEIITEKLLFFFWLVFNVLFCKGQSNSSRGECARNVVGNHCYELCSDQMCVESEWFTIYTSHTEDDVSQPVLCQSLSVSLRTYTTSPL